MIVTDWIHSIAGFFIIVGLALGFDCGGNPIFVHQYFLFLPLFVGLNLFQSAFTDWCPMITILRKLGIKEG